MLCFLSFKGDKRWPLLLSAGVIIRSEHSFTLEALCSYPLSPRPRWSSSTLAVFRDLFCEERQYRHFENYLTGLMVLENKSLSNISRCMLDSADKTNLSRFLSDAPWSQQAVNQRRVSYMLSQTQDIRPDANGSYLILDDTLCEHVGSLFEYIDRHYNHSDGSYPLAHNVVTSHYLSGAVRFPANFELYRRYEEVTQWERFVSSKFPAQVIPSLAKDRAKLHRQLDKSLLEDPEVCRIASAVPQQDYDSDCPG